VGRGLIHTQPMRKIKPPLPDLPRPDTSDPELAEERMRRALGFASNRNGQGAPPRPEQQSKPLARPAGRAPGDRPRQRFVQDGEVPVTLVGRHRPHGLCQVDGSGDTEGLRLIRSSRCRRDADHLAPGAEGGIVGGSVIGGGQAMAAELEVVVDAAVGGEEALGVAG